MPKFGGMPMGGGNMMKQVQKMQQDMMKAQADIESREFTGTAGGGAVAAVCGGDRVLRSLAISPDAIDPDDAEMLQDLIVAAVNDALKAAEDTMASAMQRFTGGLNLPF
jgi:hypothetical protein